MLTPKSHYFNPAVNCDAEKIYFWKKPCLIFFFLEIFPFFISFYFLSYNFFLFYFYILKLPKYKHSRKCFFRKSPKEKQFKSLKNCWSNHIYMNIISSLLVSGGHNIKLFWFWCIPLITHTNLTLVSVKTDGRMKLLNIIKSQRDISWNIRKTTDFVFLQHPVSRNILYLFNTLSTLATPLSQ